MSYDTTVEGYLIRCNSVVNVILKFPDDDPRAAALQEAFKSGRQCHIDWVAITAVGQPTFYDAEPVSAAFDSEGA